MSCIFGASGATPEFATPDFAYPQEVIKKARKNLDAGRDPLRCLLEITVAERAIAPDTIFTLPALVEGQLAKAKSDADRALLTAYEAEIFTSIYKDARWKYNEVDAPLMPLPEDISKWSAPQFVYKINELYDKALQLAKADNKPLADYSASIEYGKESLDYIPDIYSFIFNCKIKSLENFRMTNLVDYNILSADCDKLAAQYAPGSAPAVYWLCRGISISKSRNTGKDYLAVYKANEGKPGAPYALAKALDMGIGSFDPEANATDEERAKQIAERDDIIAILKNAIATYPGFYQKTAFQNHLNNLIEPAVSYSMPDMAAPNSDISVTLRYAFTKSVGFGLYKLPAGNTRLNGSKISASLPCIAKKTVPTTATDGKETLTFTLTEPGNYALVPMINGAVQKNADAIKIICTPFIPVNINGCTSNAVVTADYTTGAPVSGVVVDYMKAGRNDKYTKTNLGKTGRSGTLAYTSPENNRYWGSYMRFTYKNQIYEFDQNIRANTYNVRDNEDETVRYDVNVLTDRNLYHPGDTISWVVAIAEQQPGQKATVAAGRKLKIKLQNTNYQNVDSADVTTDALGRVFGAFTTQKGTLTGNYRILVQDADGVESFGSA